MRGRARVKRCQIKVWTSVHETTVFGANCEVPAEVVVGAAPVDKRSFGLTLRSGNRSAYITGRVKHEGAGTGEDVRGKSENAVWRGHDEGTRCLVHISLHSDQAGGSEVLLRVPGVAVTRVGGQPAIEVIAIA